MKNKLRHASLATLLLILVAGMAHGATFQEGYGIGCGLGTSETYLNQNLALYLATLDYAYLNGEVNYANGVEEGYAACSFQQQPVNGGGPGTICTSSDLDDPDAIETCD